MRACRMRAHKCHGRAQRAPAEQAPHLLPYPCIPVRIPAILALTSNGTADARASKGMDQQIPVPTFFFPQEEKSGE